jgi:sensor domain CHASE-containing protein
MTSSYRADGLLRAVALPTVATLLVLAAIVGAILHFSTSQSDRLAAQRQQRLVAVAIEQSVIGIANDQEASTYWDDAVLRTRERPLDLQWIDNNLGVWFYTYYQFDEAYLLDPRNAPVYAMQNGKRVAPGSFQRVAASALDLAGALRRKMKGGYLTEPGASGKTVGAAQMTVGTAAPQSFCSTWTASRMSMTR